MNEGVKMSINLDENTCASITSQIRGMNKLVTLYLFQGEDCVKIIVGNTFPLIACIINAK